METIRQKFTEECTDTSLEKYDSLVIPVSSYNTQNVFGPIVFAGVSIDKFNIRGGLQYCTSDGTILAQKPNDFGFYLSTANGDGEIVIDDKFSITHLFTNSSGYNGKVNGVKLNLQQLEYLTKIDELLIQSINVDGDVYYLRNLKGSAFGFQSIAYGTKIKGSLSYLPKTVALIYGQGYQGEGFTWIQNIRNTNSCRALCLMANIQFKTQNDLCNFLLDNSKCNPTNTITGTNRSIICLSKDGVFTLPNEVKSVMAMMCAASNIPNANSVSGYCWGLTTLKINNVTYTSQDGVNLDQ